MNGLRCLLLVTALCSLKGQTRNETELSRQSWFGGTMRSKVHGQAEIQIQPLAQQVRRLESAMQLLGQPVDKETATSDQRIK